MQTQKCTSEYLYIRFINFLLDPYLGLICSRVRIHWEFSQIELGGTYFWVQEICVDQLSSHANLKNIYGAQLSSQKLAISYDQWKQDCNAGKLLLVWTFWLRPFWDETRQAIETWLIWFNLISLKLWCYKHKKLPFKTHWK